MRRTFLWETTLQLKRVRQTTTRIPRDDVDSRAFELCAYASIMILVWLFPRNLQHSSDFTMHRSSRTRRTDSRPPCPADDVRRSDILFVNSTETAWQAQQAPLWMAQHPFLSGRRQRAWVSTAPNTLRNTKEPPHDKEPNTTEKPNMRNDFAQHANKDTRENAHRERKCQWTPSNAMATQACQQTQSAQARSWSALHE